MKRLGLFVFYDRDGIVDDYVIYLLNDLMENLDDLVVISNSDLNKNEKKKFTKFTNNIIIRENKGLDAGALCEYFNVHEEYKKYDEVVYLNDTFFGPLYPFKKVFEKMDAKKDLDFWGLSLGHITPDGYHIYEDKIIHDHLQSFFIVFRKKLVNSDVFKNYWRNYDIEKMLSFYDVVTKHELTFTKYLSDNGFKYDSYVVDSYYGIEPSRNFNNYFHNSSTQVIIDKAPFFKRKMFATDQGTMLYMTDSNELRKVMNYIETKTDYDTNLIWKNLLRLYNLHQLSISYGFNEIVEVTKEEKNKKNVHGIVMLNNIFFVEEVKKREKLFTKIDILTTRKDIVDKGQACNLDIILIEEKDVKVIQNIIKDSKEEYVCFLNFVEQKDRIILIDAVENQTTLDNLLVSEKYFNSLIEQMQKNNISMAYAPENNHYDDFYKNLFWKENIYTKIEEIMPEYKMLNRDQYPVSFNTNFIVKKEVLKHLDFMKWPQMNESDFWQVLAISLAYYGTFDGLRPMIAYEKNYFVYKMNNLECITKGTYRTLYKNNQMPVTYAEAIKYIANLQSKVTFKHKIKMYVLNHFYYPIRNRVRKLRKKD